MATTEGFICEKIGCYIDMPHDRIWKARMAPWSRSLAKWIDHVGDDKIHGNLPGVLLT